jgi:hypothetical protein
MVASPAQAAPIDLLTISDASNWAGGDLTFTVTYSGPAAESFDFSTVTGSATAGDYTATPTSPYFAAGTQTITFGASTSSVPSKATVTVHSVSDADASDENFQLSAVTHSGTPVTTVNGTGTIWAVDNANNKIVLSGATTVPETAVGGVQKSVTITATDTSPQAHDVVIPVMTADWSGGNDYWTDMANSQGGPNRDYTALPADASIVIPAYQTSGTITVQLWDDTSDEQATQYFEVDQDTNRSTLGGAVLAGQDTVRIGIQDDDATPTVSVGDANSAKEGAPLTFPITLSNPSEIGTTVDVTAAGQARGSATAATRGWDSTHPPAADFVWGTLGSATATVTVPRYAASTNVMMATTTNPGTFEGPENVNATIGNPVNSTLGSNTSANGVITDTEAGQSLELSSVGGLGFLNSTRAFVEGNAGPVDQKIYLRFAGSPTLPTTLNYKFVDSTATGGVDYTGKAGSITVPADGSIVSIPVTIVGDRIDETDETFKLVLTDPNSIADPATVGEQTFTITDDDTAPGWTTQDVSVTEGNSGQTMAHVPVTLSGPAANNATFTAVVTGGSAVDTGTSAGDNDYDLPAISSVTVKAGDTTANLDIPINGDTVYERDESFTVTFTPPGAVPSTADTVATSRVTIKNDDAMPTVTFGQISGPEGGSVQVTGTIVGTSQYPYDLGFTVAGTGDNPATPVTDFTSPTGLATATVTIPQGFSGALTDAPVSFTPLTFQLLSDSVDEATETFGVTFNEVTSPAKGFTAGTATVKIADDPLDLPPTVAIEDVSIGKWEKSVDVPVDLTFAKDNDATSTQQTVTVPYWTVDGSAKAGQDYKETKGTLSIAAGTLTSKINVPVINNAARTANGDFYVKLGKPGPAGATLGKDSSQVIVKSGGGTTPPPSTGGPSLVAPKWVTGSVAVPITGKADAGATVDLWGAPWSPAMPKLVKIDSTKADSSGNYKFSRWIGTGYRFQAASGGDVSDVVKVGINQAPAFVASSPSKGKLSVAVQGNPRGPKQAVIVQAWVGGKWVNTWKGTTGTDNLWKATVSQKSKSSWTLRAFVQGDMTWGINSGYSAAKKVTIK